MHNNGRTTWVDDVEEKRERESLKHFIAKKNIVKCFFHAEM